MKRISVLYAGLLLTLVLMMLFATRPAAADVLYSQTAANTSAWTSETANGTNGFNQAWDNFTLSSAGTVTGVAWTGWILPDSGVIDGFTIGFYSDSDNAGVHTPGALISSSSIAGDADQTADGSHNSYGIFDYDAALVFGARANTEYWISIVADPQTAIWNWANSDGGDSSFYENNNAGDAGPVGTDLAFTLLSTSNVPEPSSLVLAGSGMLAAVGLARRRFREV